MRKTKSLLIMGCILIIMSFIGSVFIEDKIGNKITDVVTLITAFVGAIAIFFQFKRDKEVNQSSFMVEFGKTFYEQPMVSEFFYVLERYREGNKEPMKTISIDHMVAYLVWLESLCSLINRGVLNLEVIDNLFSYRYFLAVNNPYVQKAELVLEKEYYVGIFSVYHKWKNFKTKNNLPIVSLETSLSDTKEYKEFMIKHNILLKWRVSKSLSEFELLE